MFGVCFGVSAPTKKIQQHNISSEKSAHKKKRNIKKKKKKAYKNMKQLN